MLPNALPEHGTYRSVDGGTLALDFNTIESSIGTLLVLDSEFGDAGFVGTRVVRGRRDRRTQAWFAGKPCPGEVVIREKQVLVRFEAPPCEVLSGQYVLIEPERAPEPRLDAGGAPLVDCARTLAQLRASWFIGQGDDALPFACAP